MLWILLGWWPGGDWQAGEVLAPQIELQIIPRFCSEPSDQIYEVIREREKLYSLLRSVLLINLQCSETTQNTSSPESFSQADDRLQAEGSLPPVDYRPRHKVTSSFKNYKDFF